MLVTLEAEILQRGGAACDAPEEKLLGPAAGAYFHVFSLFFTACSSKDWLAWGDEVLQREAAPLS